jgi:hypothetical protein
MAVPEGTIAQVLEWVSEDPQRAADALQTERSGQSRTTLITQLEAIAAKEAPMSDEPAVPAVPDEEVPAPEPPVEVEFDAADEGTIISPVHVREDVDAEDADDVTPEKQEDRDELPVDAVAVEYFQTVSNPRGFAVSINGSPAFAFNDHQAAALRGELNQAIAGIAY